MQVPDDQILDDRILMTESMMMTKSLMAQSLMAQPLMTKSLITESLMNESDANGLPLYMFKSQHRKRQFPPPSLFLPARFRVSMESSSRCLTKLMRDI